MPFWRRVVRSPASSRSHCPITRSATAGLARLDVVRTMHERKDRMAGLSDAFVMLPGGFGTLEQFMEAVTWRQLAIHEKPSGILNVDGSFADLLVFVTHA